MKQVTKKKSLVNGDLLEIEINDFGFIYAKYINVLSFYPNSNYPDLIRVYKTLYKEPLTNLKILDRDLLFSPLAIAGAKGFFKAINCKVIVNELVLKSEQVLPDVKRGHPHLEYGYDSMKYKKWIVMKNLGDTSKLSYANFENVKHLEWAGATNVEALVFRIKLELLKLQGKNIKTEIGIKDWLEEEIYKRSIDLPIYSMLDRDKRDFLIETI